MVRMDPEIRDTLDVELPRRRLIGIALLPSAMTLGNLLCGVVAIICCLMSMRVPYFDSDVLPKHPHLSALFQSYISIGAYLLVLAMAFDALDGRLARLARRTSEFGAQLDSIADIVSFGAAPCLLFLTMLIRPPVESSGAPISSLQWRVSLLGALVFVSCAAIRLARYNAENVKDESAQKKFCGLPSPGAAGAFAALLLLHEEMIQAPGSVVMGIDWARVLLWAIGPISFALGMLMVSRLDYVHLMNHYVRREQPLFYLIAIVIVGVLLWQFPQIMLVIIAFSYVISGVIASFMHRPGQTPTDEPTLTDDP